jgi:hypothetical protein
MSIYDNVEKVVRKMVKKEVISYAVSAIAVSAVNIGIWSLQAL